MHPIGQNFAYDPSNTSILKMVPQPTTSKTQSSDSQTPSPKTSTSTPSLQETLYKTPTSTTTSTLAETQGQRKASLDSSASSMTSTIKPEKEGMSGEGGQEGKGQTGQGKKSISALMKKTKEGLRRTFAFPEDEGEFKAHPTSFRSHARV